MRFFHQPSKPPVWGRHTIIRCEAALNLAFQRGVISEERKNDLLRRLETSRGNHNRNAFERWVAEINAIERKMQRELQK